MSAQEAAHRIQCSHTFIQVLPASMNTNLPTQTVTNYNHPITILILTITPKVNAFPKVDFLGPGKAIVPILYLAKV